MLNVLYVFLCYGLSFLFFSFNKIIDLYIWIGIEKIEKIRRVMMIENNYDNG